MAPLAALGKPYTVFSQTLLERRQSQPYEHIRTISIGLIFFQDHYKMQNTNQSFYGF